MKSKERNERLKTTATIVIGYILCIMVLIFSPWKFSSLPLFTWLLVTAFEIGIPLVAVRYIGYEVDRDVRSNKIAILNKSILYIPIFILSLVLRNSYTKEEQSMRIIKPLMPKGRLTLRGEVSSDHPGAILMEVDSMMVAGFLHWFPMKVKASVKSDYYHVMPFTEKREVNIDNGNIYDMESFKYALNKRGDDPGETFGIREYRPGDKVKAIHWKLSAKMRGIVIRELGLPIENKVLLILDPVDVAERNKIAEAVNALEIYASTAYSLVEANIDFAMGWYDSNDDYFHERSVMSKDDILRTIKDTMETINVGKFEDNYMIPDMVISDYSHFIIVTSELKDIERLTLNGTVTQYNPI